MNVLIVGNNTSWGALLKKNLPFDTDVIQFFPNTRYGKAVSLTFSDNAVDTIFVDCLIDAGKRVVYILSKKRYDLIFYINISVSIIRYVNIVFPKTRYIIFNTGSGKYGLYRSHNFIEQDFITIPALKNAELLLCYDPRRVNYLKQFNQVKLVPQMYDEETFDSSTYKKRYSFKKFTFLLPGRMDGSKGHDIIWKAIELTTEDFIVLQPDWGNGAEYTRIKETAPSKVKFIPLIPHNELVTWLSSVDAVIGQMSLGWHGVVELEATAMHLPVTLYTPFKELPFLPKSQDPYGLAELIDRIVKDPDFRVNYSNLAYDYVRNNNSSELVSRQIESIIYAATYEKNPQNRRLFSLSSDILLRLMTFLYSLT